MKILVIGDIHFSESSPIRYFNNFYSDGISYNIRRALISLKWIENLIDLDDYDTVVQVGDVFNTFEYISKIVMYHAHNSFLSLHNKCKEKHIPFYIVPGNHDIIGIGKYLTEVLPCDAHFSTPALKSFSGAKIHFIPFMDSQASLYNCIINSPADIIFTHTNVKGIAYNKYKQSESGLDTTFLKNKLVISGHIHAPQFVNSNMHLVGSLYQILFQEKGNIPHGVSVIDTKSMEITRIVNNVVIKLVIITKKQDLSAIDKSNCLIRAITDDKTLIKYLLDEKYTYEVIPPKIRNSENEELRNTYDITNTPVEVIKRYIKDNHNDLYPLVGKYFNK